MSQDNFVWWQDSKPTKKEIELVIIQFFGGAVTDIVYKQETFIVHLVGQYSEPLKGLGVDRYELCGEPRTIEVHAGPDCLDVLTRMQDEFTNALATRLAKIFARRWGGRLDNG